MNSLIRFPGSEIGKTMQTCILIILFGYQLLHMTSGYSDSQYIGCFQEGTPRQLSHLETVSDVTVQKCIDACKHSGFTFAGLQYGNNCWCGDQYYGFNSSGCDMTCQGNKSQICGGVKINSIYSVCPPMHYGSDCSSACAHGCLTDWCNLQTGACIADVDECSVKEISDTCSQICTNTNGSYKCTCRRGYNQPKLNGNCEAVNGIPPYAVMLVVLAILIPVSIGANLALVQLHKHLDKKYQIKRAQELEEERRREEESGYINPTHHSNDDDLKAEMYKQLHAEGANSHS